MIRENIPRTAVILVNLGTPENTSSRAVRAFLKEFLSDPRVVDRPRWWWLPLLNLVILPLRSKRSAANYAKIWQTGGSPLYRYGRDLRLALNREKTLGQRVRYYLAMTYGQPSLERVWQEMEREGMDRVLLLPLFPQYSTTTTAAVFDAWSRLLQQKPIIPEFVFLQDYADEEAYIQALVDSIRVTWQQRPRADHLVFSFHGIPQRLSDGGDPYASRCQETARRCAALLDLEQERWSLAYQSRFGPEQWLLPDTSGVLTDLAENGVRSVEVICPGFSVDCLETLEEIDQENRSIFLAAGGESFYYIACLNASDGHRKMIEKIVARRLDPPVA